MQYKITSASVSKTEVSNSDCSEGQTRTYKVTWGPHYDADASMAVPELTTNILFPAKSIMSYLKSFLAVSTFVQKKLVH